jgi:hypothetical protein
MIFFDCCCCPLLHWLLLSQGHFSAVKLPELQQLLLLHELLGVTAGSDWVERLLLMVRCLSAPCDGPAPP